jgi:hypothetical protein
MVSAKNSSGGVTVSPRNRGEGVIISNKNREGGVIASPRNRVERVIFLNKNGGEECFTQE